MSLDKAQILAAKDHQKELVPVPEWGGEVFVRSMTGTAFDAFQGAMLDPEQRFVNLRARFAALTICGEDGELLFGPDDIVALGQKSPKALDRVFEVAQKLNGMSDEAFEELEKPLEPTHASDSGSGSPDSADDLSHA